MCGFCFKYLLLFILMDMDAVVIDAMGTTLGTENKRKPKQK